MLNILLILVFPAEFLFRIRITFQQQFFIEASGFKIKLINKITFRLP